MLSSLDWELKMGEELGWAWKQSWCEDGTLCPGQNAHHRCNYIHYSRLQPPTETQDLGRNEAWHHKTVLKARGAPGFIDKLGCPHPSKYVSLQIHLLRSVLITVALQTFDSVFLSKKAPHSLAQYGYYLPT